MMLDLAAGQDAVVDDGSTGSVVDAHSNTGELQWSPTGDVLAYAKFDRSTGVAIGLWEVSPGARPFALVPTSGVGGVAGFYWSPSGRQIAYGYGLRSFAPTPTPSKVTSYPAGGIYLVNADGSDAHMLADGGFVLYSSNPWSPDGRLLAYWKNVHGGSALTGDTYVMDVGSGREISLGAFSSDEHVGWSPGRGRDVFYNLEIDPQTGSVNSLFDPAGSLIDWSPDGKKVAYIQYAPRPSRSHSLVVLDTDNGRQTIYETSTVDLWVHEPGYRGDWSPDSRYYAFTGYAFVGVESPPGGVLYVADARSGATNRVLDGTGGFGWYSPDGSYLLIQQGSSAAPSIWIANADGSSASKLVDGTALSWGWGPLPSPWRPITS